MRWFRNWAARYFAEKRMELSSIIVGRSADDEDGDDGSGQ